MLCVMYIAFLIRWYVLKCVFHIFCTFLGKKRRCCAALFVNTGKGVVLHVFSVVLDIFWMMCYNFEHANSQWLSGSWSTKRRVVIVFSTIAFSSKNMVLNCSTVSGGIGFIILVGQVVGGDGHLASSMFCGMFKIIGK